MKKTTLTLITLLCMISSTKAQILYDNGSIDDSNNSLTVGGRGWDHTNLTYFFENGTTDIPNDNEKNAITEAMSVWESSSEITFTEVSNVGSADIIIKWATGSHGDNNSFDGTGSVLAHAFSPPPNGGSLAGDVHFDDDENWSTDVQVNSSQPIDLVTVAIHELGHSLGLGHSDVSGAIMYAYYNGSQRYLANDDIQSISRLYPKKRLISGTNTICNSTNYTYTVNDITVNNVVSWSTSSNIEKIKFSNSSVTVSTINSNATGRGWIKANIDGVEVIKDVWIGVPTGYSDGNISIHHSSMDESLFLNNWTRMWVEGDYNGSNWEWAANYSIIRGNNFSTQILIKPIALGYVTIKARLKNDCGNGAWISKNFYVTERPEGGHHYRGVD